MKKRIISALLLAIFFTSLSYAQRPDWIDNPGKTFFSGDIYAVGTGKTLNAAQSDARAGILKFFETQINSKFQASLTGADDISTRLSKEEIEESAKGIVKGISITKTYKDTDAFYALAVLDKSKALKEIVYEIDQLDSKMEILLAELDDKQLESLEKMFLKRVELNKKHILIADRSVKEKIPQETILAALKNKKPLSFYLVFKEGVEAGITPTKNTLTKMINDNNQTVAHDIEKADRIVTFYETLEEQYLNVAGFMKLKVTFRIECRDGSQTISSVTKEYIETGRNTAQIYEKALSQFLPFLSSQREKLLK